MRRKNKTGTVGVILTIITLIILVFVSNINIKELSYIENIFNKFVMPVQNGLTYLKNKVSGNNAFFTDISNLKTENEELKARNSELEQNIRELEIIRTENTTLKEYLNLSEKYTEYKTVPANVINMDISNYNKTIVINIGTRDGIKPDMTVIADKGLVGHVISVTDSTAKVQTIIDANSGVSAKISSTRDSIVCRGLLESNLILKAVYIPTESYIIEGDVVETSGMGGIYPKGIHIGTVSEVIQTKNPIDRYANIKTAVDFLKLETVLVITN